MRKLYCKSQNLYTALYNFVFSYTGHTNYAHRENGENHTKEQLMKDGYCYII